MTVLRDIAIDPVTRDLVFDGQNFAINEGRRAVAQRLSIKFGTFEGEWYLDESAGLPYQEQVLVRNPNLSVIGALFRREILGTPGVTGLRSFDLDFDSANRRLSLDFVAETDEGEVAITAAEGTLAWVMLLF